jgi:hypothetical protein
MKTLTTNTRLPYIRSGINSSIAREIHYYPFRMLERKKVNKAIR